MPASKLRILDGASCIGGNKIVLELGGDSALLDFGINMKRKREYALGYRALTIANKLYYYLYSEILPKVSGIYRSDLLKLDERVRDLLEKGEGVNASLCVVSHAHVDHYGSIGFLSEEIKLAVSRSMKTIMETALETSAAYDVESEVFRMRDRSSKGSDRLERRVEVFEEGSKIGGAPFRLVPHPIDHSIPASFGFLAEDLSLAYTGDIRRHGILRSLTDEFVRKIEGVDYLLIEGTRIDSSIRVPEEEVSAEIKRYVVEKGDKLVCVITSPTDIDRIRDLIKLSEEVGRIPVVCPRSAYLIDRLMASKTRIKLPDLSNVGIYFERRSLGGGGYELASQHYRPWLRRVYSDRLDGRRPGFLVKSEDVARRQERYLMILNGLDYVLELAQIKPRPGSRVIVSTSEPHDEEQEIEWSKFERWINLLRLDLRIAHSSGHADRETLIEIIEEVKPRKIIPIHTENPYEFQRLARIGEIKSEVLIPEVGKPIPL